MRVWTMFLALAVACLVAVNVSAQEKKDPSKRHSPAERFAKMDANHDGILTEAEFVTARSAKMGEEKAKQFYGELTKLGGTTTKDGAAGMTLEQFTKAFEEWRKAHPRKGHGDKQTFRDAR
jgi:Ca2+-binding EF-hand superfamily protein